MRTYFLLILLVVIRGLAGKADSPQERLNQYLKVLQKTPDDFNTLWHAAELYVHLSSALKTTDEKRDFCEKSKTYADRCLQLQPESWQANYVMAVAYGALQEVSGDTKFRLNSPHVVKKHINKALSLNPKFAECWMVLGLWHFKLSNLGWKERMFIGDIKNEASNEKSKECLLKAISLDLKNLKFYLMIANTCEKLGQKSEAISYLDQAIARNSGSVEDQFICDKCRAKLKEWQ